MHLEVQSRRGEGKFTLRETRRAEWREYLRTVGIFAIFRGLEQRGKRIGTYLIHDAYHRAPSRGTLILGILPPQCQWNKLTHISSHRGCRAG